MTELDLGQPAPEFALPDLDGQLHRLSDYRGGIVVVNFWSAECPWSERTDKDLLASLTQMKDRVTFLEIASNDNESTELLREIAHLRGIPLVLRDKNGKVADIYHAQTTPHAFVVDETGILRYRGAIDDVTFRNRTATRFYVEEAVEALWSGNSPAILETQPYGCTIVRLA